MTITKTSLLDMVGFDVADNGNIQARIAKLTHIDGRLVAREYHRIDLPPGADIDMILAANNEHLIRLGFTAIDDEGVQAIKANARLKWTPDRIAKYEAEKKAEREEQERNQQLAEAAQAKQKEEQQAAFDAAVAAAVERINGNS